MALKPPEVPHLAGRHAALRQFGIRPYEAAWLTLVCLHSGAFTRTQFTRHHRCSTKTTHAFVHRLVAAGVARERPMPGAGTRLRYTHVYDRRLYRALGVEHLRHRRAAKRARRYFALRLPIAADHRSATFVYADPGRYTDTELRSWAAGHRHLWARLRALRTEVHVAGVARTLVKQHALSRRIAAWADSPAARPLSPEERATLAAVRAAIHSADPAVLEAWGGFHAARRILLPLQQQADLEAVGGTSGPAVDGYSTHHAQHLGPLGLA